MDLPALPRCKRTKGGAHDLAAIVPGDDDHDLTLYCTACGALRRLPASGPVLTPRLDDETADIIAAVAHNARRAQ
jgi:hypothetical protein